MLGDILIGEGKAEEGWDAYESGIRINSGSPAPCYYRLGNTLAGASCPEKAVGAFQRAIIADPQIPLYYLKLAESYLALGHEALALEVVQKAEALA